MTDLDHLEEINLLPDRTERSDKLARSNRKNWNKFGLASSQRPLWKRQLATSHATRARMHMTNKAK